MIQDVKRRSRKPESTGYPAIEAYGSQVERYPTIQALPKNPKSEGYPMIYYPTIGYPMIQG